MRKLIKTVSIIIALALLLSACGTVSVETVTAQIEEYFKANQYNDCLEYANQLEVDVKSQVNASVLSLISAEYNNLVEENKVDTKALYSLDAIDNNFAENCRKLWNIAKEFTITKDDENYTDFVHLHYFAEMCNYTKYGEIYSLLESVHKSGYLNEITDALYAYDSEGDIFAFDEAYKSALMFEYSSFDPQEYLVEDYRNAHNQAVKALKSLSNGFATSDINVIASSMGDLEDALSAILHITDTLNAIHAKQIYIFNELSNGELNAVFNTDLEISERDYEIGIVFSLDNIFGASLNDEENGESNENSETDEKISKSDALKIAVNAINKTKAYKNKVNIEYKQTINIQMTSFENNSSINDTVELAKSTINNALDGANGTKKTNFAFTNGASGNVSLNSFIPPSDKNAVGYADSIKDYSVISGSGGYVITIAFLPEATTKNSSQKSIGSVINGFLFEKSENLSNYKSTYSTAALMVTVNNSGFLEKMEYEISGVSDCSFKDDNNKFLFDAQFSFSEKYNYSFKY